MFKGVMVFHKGADMLIAIHEKTTTDTNVFTDIDIQGYHGYNNV
jgi:hypothetical protein